MKRTLLLLITFTLYLQANFWTTIDLQNIVEAKLLDNNSSITDINETKIKQQADFFSKLTTTIKLEPYLLKENNHGFYDKQKFDFQKKMLDIKIKANTKHEYKNAILRDTLKLKEILTKEYLYNSLILLASILQKNDDNKLQEVLNNQANFIQSIKIQSLKFQILSMEESSLNKTILQNYTSLSKIYEFSKKFFEYLNEHQSLLKTTSFVNMLNIGTIIDVINNKDYFSKLNYYLNKIDTDIGRIIIFILVISFFLLFKNIVFKVLLPMLKKLLDDDKENFNDILLDYFESIKKPLSYIVIIFGMDIALETLVYPNAVATNWVNLSYLLYLLIYARISIVIIDIALEAFVTKKASSTKSIRKELINLIIILFKSIIYIIVFLLFIKKLGVDITGFIASLGIGGLAFAFAAKDTIANFFGSIKIIIDNAFSQGDWIKTNDAEGTVVQLGLISTTIRTFDNALVTVPNANIASSSIKNWNRRELGRRIKMHVGVTYSANKVDLQNAVVEIRQMLVNHADIATTSKKQQMNKHKRKLLSYEDHQGVKKTLLVYVDEFAGSSINILIYTFTNSTNWQTWLEIKEDIMYKVWDILEENNLEFAFPSQTLYLKNDDKKGDK